MNELINTKMRCRIYNWDCMAKLMMEPTKQVLVQEGSNRARTVKRSRVAFAVHTLLYLRIEPIIPLKQSSGPLDVNSRTKQTLWIARVDPSYFVRLHPTLHYLQGNNPSPIITAPRMNRPRRKKNPYQEGSSSIAQDEKIFVFRRK